MAKKTSKKKAQHVQWTVRTSPDLRDWLNDKASEMGISRDLFMRRILEGLREYAERQDIDDQNELFKTVENDYMYHMEQAIAAARERGLVIPSHILFGEFKKSE